MRCRVFAVLLALLITLGGVASPLRAQAPSCRGDEETLCLLGGRFQVRATWKNQYGDGAEGTGKAVPLTDKTGVFWFFKPDNYEVMIKILDGQALNGRFWFYLGALSDVEYLLAITDTVTGEEKVYRNPPGNTYGLADTRAFPSDGVGDFCGGFAGVACPGDLFCDQDPGFCDGADIGGTCVDVPETCIEIFEPVCGCDGVTYGNDCLRRKAGATKDHDGPCQEQAR